MISVFLHGTGISFYLALLIETVIIFSHVVGRPYHLIMYYLIFVDGVLENNSKGQSNIDRKSVENILRYDLNILDSSSFRIVLSTSLFNTLSIQRIFTTLF